jgi:hypothetical protein
LFARSIEAWHKSSASAGLRASAWAKRRKRGSSASISSSNLTRRDPLYAFVDETSVLPRFIHA